ncbi:hypothetical protein B0H14DRAFT_2606852 [Mycena olivaceomarginata]|nr:hypothetical protein B0H14DRAFT_2606852 [Mycena olivaceomarginata]
MRMTKEQRRAAAQPLSYEHNSETIPDVRSKLPDHLSHRGEILFPNGRMLVQRPLPPRVATQPLISTLKPPWATKIAYRTSVPIFDIERTPPISPSKHRKKRAAQWRRWDQEIIPLLIPHYSWVVWETKCWRELEKLGPPVQDCDCIPRIQRVTIMQFSSVEDMDVPVCECRLAAVTLVRGGAFPCAPLQPSLAVDLRVLEFALKLFLNGRAKPYRVLHDAGDCLEYHGNTLCRRFSNALDMVRAPAGPVQKPITARRWRKMRSVPPAPVVARDESPDSSPHRRASPARSSTPVTPRPHRSPSRSPSPARHIWGQPREPTPGGLPPTTPSRSEREPPEPPRIRKRGRSPRPDRPDPPFPDPPPRACPSEYLRSRCPLCFGNSYHDPLQLSVKPRPAILRGRHPCSHFVPEADAKATDAYVNETRGTFGPAEPRSKKSKTKTTSAAEGDRGRVRPPRPSSPLARFLDACKASFKAADEKRVKASTDFFEDTGLMALLCRHDRVLWLVNMQTRGEQQYYVIVLLETLFQHLPQDITVGILYDIACTLERSCRKWGFLSRFMHRIQFAVSPYQLLYHPRKRTAFGLSDSEGCERFWHAISHLIAVLRISGKWQRLYVLDAQIEHADELSLQRLGDWLRQRSLHSRKKRQEAESALAECRVRISVLREQWQLQVIAQTNPFPFFSGRSKNKGQQAINAILLLRSAVKKQTDYVNRLRAKFLGAAEDADEEADYYQVEFDKADAARATAEKTLREKERALGVGERRALGKMSHLQYYNARMNARATKRRLRDRLRQRKFKLDLVERSFRRLVNEQKLYSHTEAAVKRREKGIQNLAFEYNKQCAKVAQLIRDKNAPRGNAGTTAHPRRVNYGSWTSMMKFGKMLASTTTKPLSRPPTTVVWIKAVLQIDRSNEEDIRLKKEQAALQIPHRTDTNTSSCAMTSYISTPSVGPNATQLARARLDTRRAARGEDRHYNADQAEFSDEEEEWESGGENEVFSMLDTLATADAYREEDWKARTSRMT